MCHKHIEVTFHDNANVILGRNGRKYKYNNYCNVRDSVHRQHEVGQESGYLKCLMLLKGMKRLYRTIWNCGVVYSIGEKLKKKLLKNTADLYS